MIGILRRHTPSCLRSRTTCSWTYLASGGAYEAHSASAFLIVSILDVLVEKAVRRKGEGGGCLRNQSWRWKVGYRRTQDNDPNSVGEILMCHQLQHICHTGESPRLVSPSVIAIFPPIHDLVGMEDMMHLLRIPPLLQKDFVLLKGFQ